jgi:hypothetical protein
MDLFSPEMITRLFTANERSNQPLTRGGRADAGDDGGLLRALAMHPLGDGPSCFIGAIGTCVQWAGACVCSAAAKGRGVPCSCAHVCSQLIENPLGLGFPALHSTSSSVHKSCRDFN